MKKLLLIILLSNFSIICFAQNLFFYQDSTTHSKERLWFDVNTGLYLTKAIDGIDFLSGFSININYIDENYIFYKFKVGHHKGFEILFPSNIYQSINEWAILTGKNKYKKRKNFGFAFGLGLGSGVKYTSIIDHGSGFDLDLTSNFNTKNFITFCIPFELYSNYNFNKFGIGLKWENNLNIHLPYTGLSLLIELNNARK